MKLYTIRDVVTNSYGLPFCAVNDGDAMRRLEYSVKNGTLINPEDLELFYLADFDLERGVITGSTPDVPCLVLASPQFVSPVIGGVNA